MKISDFNPIKKQEVPKELLIVDPELGTPLEDEQGNPLFKVMAKTILCKSAREYIDDNRLEEDAEPTEEQLIDRSVGICMSVITEVSSPLKTDDGKPITMKTLPDVLREEAWLRNQIERFAMRGLNIDRKKQTD